MQRQFTLATLAATCATAAVMAACSPPQTPEQAFVASVEMALGGGDRIAAIKTLTLQGEGTAGNLGQDMTPEATGQAFALTEFTRRLDLTAVRERTEVTRTPNFVYFQGPQAQKQIQGIDGDVAYNVGASGNATRLQAAAAADRRTGYYHHPITLARLLLDPATKVSNLRTEGGQQLADVAGGGLVLTLAIDATTHRPVRVSSKTTNPNLGDVTLATSFDDYQAVSGVQLPARLTTKVDDFRAVEYRLSTQTVDGETGDLSAPAAAASAAVPTPAAPNVTAEEVVPGVWWLAGQSHHSALVEFSDHLMLLEAPQSEARTLAVIAKIKELRPGKPITQVVNSHHHFDHSAGIRAAIAEGATVITHDANRAFFEQLAKRPFTIAPDTLAKSPKPATVQTIGDELELKDATRTVVLYPLPGNPHGDAIVMAYLPKERILIQADAYSPEGGGYHPYAANLLENVQKRKLRVDRLVPLHGKIAPFSELVKTAAEK